MLRLVYLYNLVHTHVFVIFTDNRFFLCLYQYTNRRIEIIITLKTGQIAARTIPGILYWEALFPLPQITTTSLKIGFCSACNFPTLFIKSVKYKFDPSWPWGGMECGLGALVILLKPKIFVRWKEKDEMRSTSLLRLYCSYFKCDRSWP